MFRPNPKKNILVVGKNSYLARHFLSSTYRPSGIEAISHDTSGSVDFSDFKVVVNFACDDNYLTKPYDPQFDFDRVLLKHLKNTGAHYVMLSSRMVYAPALNLIEDATISPQGDYGMNKSITEKLVRECLPDRHTILRISNIIGPNMRPHTFLGHASQTLAGRNEIILDIHENTLKDFIPIDQFSYALARAVESLPLGTFNIGSGVGTGVGDIASWVVEGLGRGKVVCAGSDRVGEFILNIERLTSAIGSFSRPDEIRPSCVDVGQSIRNG